MLRGNRMSVIMYKLDGDGKRINAQSGNTQ
jgi:hypothetical protein